MRISELENKEVVLFGSGAACDTILDLLEVSVAYIVDNDPHKNGSSKRGLPIHSPEILLKERLENIAILIASSYVRPIQEQLNQMGFHQNIHYHDAMPWHYAKLQVDWENKGKPLPPPHSVKYTTILKYRNLASCFIETGTLHGHTLNVMKNYFDVLYSIELDQDLYEKAAVKFQDDRRVHLIRGDSSVEMPKLLEKINQPCLFWLDGHYSGIGTAKGIKHTPIAEELHHIFQHPVRDHTILIDDARLFDGTDDYPEINDLLEYIAQERPASKVVVENDIIQIILQD